MNVNEYGVQFVFGVSFDMSAWTALTMVFTKPDGTLLTVTNPAVSIQNSPLTTPNEGTLLANQYGLYTFKNGDVNQAGTWTARMTYTDATPQHLISGIASFVIGP